MQGVVIYLIDASKNVVVSYDYDPYGKTTNVVDSTANASSVAGENGTDDVQPYANIPTEPEDTTKTLAELNPLRYRGYYYDNDDVGFYYLQSRYYDATTCRFISADSYAITGLGLVGYNMFAYCNNEPRYIAGRLKRNLGLHLKLSYITNIQGGTFTKKTADYTYYVRYWNEGGGILRYDYQKFDNSYDYNFNIMPATIAAIAVACVYVAVAIFFPEALPPLLYGGGGGGMMVNMLY